VFSRHSETALLSGRRQQARERPKFATTFIFSSPYSYYGLWLWFPELFTKLDQYYEHHNETKSVCQIADFENAGTPVDPCDVPPPSNQVYINSFLISLAALPGNIWCILQMDKLGRKFFLGKSKRYFMKPFVSI
jgi:hypothetical protein